MAKDYPQNLTREESNHYYHTSKTALWWVALHLAIRLTGNEDRAEALRLVENEERVLRQAGIL